MQKSIWNFTQKYDLFSQPFSFLMGGSTKRSTRFGGLMSLIIIIVSMSYLGYLVFNYFSYKIYPNVSNSIKVNDLVEIELQNNFHMFQVLINGVPLEEYEAKQNKKYVNFRIVYEEFTDTSHTQNEILIGDCLDPDFPTFKCIQKDEKKYETYMNAKTRAFGSYALLLGKCIKEVQDNCATDDEIDELFSDINNFIEFYMQIRQYNSLERKFEVGFKSEFIYIDTSQITFSTITIKKSTSQITDGLIIQSTDKSDGVYDYTRYDSYYQKDGYKYYDKPDFKLLVGISFGIDQISNYVIVQHTQITQVLAQFTSVFNSLLVIGIFARLIANKNIQSDIISILLTDQYKEEAFKIIQHSQGKLNQSKSNKQQINDKNVQKNNISILIQNKIHESPLQNNRKKKQLDLQLSQKTNSSPNQKYIKNIQIEKKNEKKQEQEKIFQDICNQHTSIKKSKLDLSISSILNISFFERMKQQILKLWCYTKKQSEDNEVKSMKSILKIIDEEMRSQLNIYSIYKELIQLKMAIKIMFTEDQYAALHYCTSSILQVHDSLKKNIKKTNLDVSQSQQVELNNIHQLKSTISRNIQVEQDKLSDYNLVPNIIQRQQEFSKQKFIDNIIGDKSPDALLTNRKETHIKVSQERKFIQHFEDQTIKKDNKLQLQEVEKLEKNNKLNDAILGDTEGNFQNESLNDEIDIQEIDITDMDIKKTKIQNDSNIKNYNLTELNVQPNQEILSKSQYNLPDNHLIKMDMIDKDNEMRLFFLNKFIYKITSQQNNGNINNIDTNIFKSLFK